jgi:hypothetical protein
LVHGRQPTCWDQLRGKAIQPEDAGYDEARAVHNRSIDRRPGAIARCADVAAMITTIRLPRGEALVSLRGGGQNGSGLGVSERRARNQPVVDGVRNRHQLLS